MMPEMEIPKSVSPWIKISDKMPPYYTHVFLWKYIDEQWIIGRWFNKQDSIAWEDNSCCMRMIHSCDISHWLPLDFIPDGPEENK